jgi:phosphoglycerate dehydrogenase-like enzyme
MRIAILDDIHHAWGTTSGVRKLRERAVVEILTEPLASPAALDGFDAVIANRERTRFDRELLAALKTVKLIVQTGNHANHIDFNAAHALGIAVAKASGGYSVGAAELAIGLAIACMRQIPQLDRQIREGGWQVPSTPVLQGKTFGVVGLGRVGSHAARLAGAFGMHVIAWSPTLDGARAAAAGAGLRELDTLLAEADVVSIHASLTPATRGLIDNRRLHLMRRTAWLINTARGPIVDEGALISALEAGHIAGAGLDVFDQEPLPAGHPLTKLPNVILTPHIGWPTDAGYAHFAEAACDVLYAFMEGRDIPLFVSAHH